MSLPSRAIIYDGLTKVGDVFVNCGWWVSDISVYDTMRQNIIGVNGLPYWTHAIAYDVSFTKEQLHDDDFRETLIVKHVKTRDDGSTHFKPVDMALIRHPELPEFLAHKIVGVLPEGFHSALRLTDLADAIHNDHIVNNSNDKGN